MIEVAGLFTRVGWWHAGGHPAPTKGWIAAAVTGACVIAAGAVIALVLVGFRNEDDDSDHRGGGHGWGPRRPRPPDPDPHGGLERWWPEFERQFADYVNDSARDGGSQGVRSERPVGDQTRDARIRQNPPQQAVFVHCPDKQREVCRQRLARERGSQVHVLDRQHVGSGGTSASKLVRTTRSSGMAASA